MSRPNNSHVVVYTPTSRSGGLLRLLSNMFSDLVASHELSWRLFVRDLSARYRQSVLGILWAFIPPLATGLTFILLQAADVIDAPLGNVPYPIYVLTGTILWQIFAEAVTAPLRSVQAARAVVAKINFPREALLLSAFYEQLFGCAIKLLVIGAVYLAMGWPLGPWFVLAIPFVLLLMLLGFAVGILLTPIGLLYADIGNALPLMLQLLFYLTPVVYSPPKKFPYTVIEMMNPVTPLLATARDLLISGITPSNIGALATVACGLVVVLLFGWAVYRISMPVIIERMSS